MASNQVPAYLIICMTHIEGRDLDPRYIELAEGPALKSGHRRIGSGHVGDGAQLLEGALPEGAQVILLEEFPSMEALRAFWFSEEYQKAIPFRRDSIAIHFVVAVEGAKHKQDD